MRYRVGIYPGTFDPIHSGHVAFAVETMRVCHLDEVVFLPERLPRGKQHVTDMSHRVALIKKVIKNTAGLRVIELDSERFTVQETLPELQDVFSGKELLFLLGSDVVQTLINWDEIGVLLKNASFAIGMRTDDDTRKVRASIDKLQDTYNVALRTTYIQTSYAHMASSQIRKSSDISRFHPLIRGYITQYKLYQPSFSNEPGL